MGVDGDAKADADANEDADADANEDADADAAHQNTSFTLSS